MSNKKDKDDYGLSLDDFKYGLLLGIIGVILWAAVNIVSTWYPDVLWDVLKTAIYFIVIIAGLTALVDYFMADKGKKKGKK